MAHMSDRRRQELGGLQSIYTVNMSGYKSAPHDIIRIVFNFHNVVFFYGGGANFQLCSEMSNIKCAVSERVNSTKFQQQKVPKDFLKQ
jgi:hypothetical protein